MKRMEDQTILITGATDGIGRLAARDLARMGARVLLHGRDPERGESALKEIRSATGNSRLEFYRADFSSLSEVRRMAGAVRRNHDSLDILINNAGIGPGKKDEKSRSLSRDGHELRFAVNYLAPFLLTRLLLPALRKASPSRIVNVSSGAQSRIDFEDPMFERGYDPMKAYARSKLALAMFTVELARRLKDERITANSLHPGSLLDTKMVRETFGSPMGSAQSGADVEVYVATSPELEGVTGKYFEEKKEADAHPQAYDETAGRKLWELSETLTGVREDR